MCPSNDAVVAFGTTDVVEACAAEENSPAVLLLHPLNEVLGFGGGRRTLKERLLVAGLALFATTSGVVASGEANTTISPTTSSLCFEALRFEDCRFNMIDRLLVAWFEFFSTMSFVVDTGETVVAVSPTGSTD